MSSAATEIILDEPIRAARDRIRTGETVPVTVIEPRSGWRFVDWRELVAYQDLFRFLVWREIKVRYAQSAVGIGWAVIQPVFSMLVFTLLFGKLMGIESNGVPYAMFSFAALVPWTYFSNAVTEGTNSLVTGAQMISKVYFPRVLLPLSSVAARLVDFAIALVLLFVLMAWFGQAPTVSVVVLPFVILLMVLTAAGLALWLTALAIQYRDVKYAITFVMQLLMYAAPVVYPASKVEEKLGRAAGLVYALNPMVAVIEGFRAGLLDGYTQPMPWDDLAVGSVSALLIAVSGLLYFRRRERVFADVA